MPNAWGQAWGGDNGAWGLSWGSSGVAPPPVTPAAESLRYPGSHPFLQIPERRKKHGIPQEVDEIIKQVAASQVARLELDKQKQFEELERELELRALKWERKYLRALAEEREFLIHEEIGRLLKERMQRDEEEAILAILLAIS